MDAAAARLNEASALIPSEPSLAQLQSELNELKFKKGSSAFKDSVVNSHFDDAKKELSQLQALNVEPEQTGALATQLAMGIKNAVSSAINRGKDALKSNNVDQAGEALAEASALDSANADVLAFEIQFGATGQWEQVVAMAQKAHDADPGNADAVHFLAVAQDGLDKQHRAMAASLLAQARDAAAKSDWNKADELSVASNQMTSTPEAIALAAHSQFMLLPVLKIETVSGHLGTAQADGTAVKVVGTYLPYPSSTGRYTWLEFMLNEGGTKFRLHAYFDPPLDKTSPVVAHLTQGARCEFTGMIGDVSGGPFRGQWAAPGPYLYNTELVAP